VSRQVGDYHAVIAHVASRYHFPPTPQFINDLQDLLNAILRAAAEFLQRLFGYSSVKEVNSMAASDLLRGLVVILGVVSFVVLIFVAVRRLTALSAQARRANGVSIFRELYTADQWRAQAIEASARGDFRNACRALYMSCLRRLDEQSIIPFSSARTNYEYYLALHGQKTLQIPFRGLANIFDALWFGYRSAGEEEFQLSLGYLDQIEASIATKALAPKASLDG
jgi:hypothetical protein